MYCHGVLKSVGIPPPYPTAVSDLLRVEIPIVERCTTGQPGDAYNQFYIHSGRLFRLYWSPPLVTGATVQSLCDPCASGVVAGSTERTSKPNWSTREKRFPLPQLPQLPQLLAKHHVSALLLQVQLLEDRLHDTTVREVQREAGKPVLLLPPLRP